ncbi:MAG TPA: dTDP-4-dehydrorhamnose 3,5-epimerase [Methanocorpusculum sp.]|nr:dTDP-4-dehydrorhamnose 3,5-epimerase [Methanocorpusculum sp.]HJK80410.1 dTDP-4-dehydrorhamnose 3,5-epimerase [Methanocorpusculum sp.]
MKIDFNVPLKGITIIEAEPFKDHRGIFSRWFCKRELGEIIGDRQIINVNYSKTRKKGSIRGMHFQRPPYAEMKMVRCIRGKILDVVVDIRKDSPTFLQHYGVELSAENMKLFVIPEGFAHGFQSLEDDCEIMYLVTEFYSPESEGGLRYNDPALDIAWPLEVSDISEKDGKHPLITHEFLGLDVSMYQKMESPKLS